MAFDSLTYHREWRAAHPGKSAEYTRAWRKRHPEARKRWLKNNWKKHLQQSKLSMRRYCEKYPERYKATLRKSYRKHRVKRIQEVYGRLHFLVGGYTATEWRALKKKYGNKCLCCGRSHSQRKLTVDHVIPISKGGPNTIDNIQPLCQPCNSTKHDKTIDYRAEAA